jgi:restriction system protein
MPIPDFQTIMLPLLQIFADEREHAIHEYLDKLAEHFSLTEQELNEMLSSGKQTTFYNRVGWARTYLSKSGLLEMTRRSYYRITERGKKVLKSNPARVDMKYLEQFPEYVIFRERDSGRRRSRDKETTEDIAQKTPEETLEDAYQEIRDTLAQDLLALVKQSKPVFFERLVVELLVKMGYGGSRREAG